jgi:hypothetical protein
VRIDCNREVENWWKHKHIALTFSEPKGASLRHQRTSFGVFAAREAQGMRRALSPAPRAACLTRRPPHHLQVFARRRECTGWLIPRALVHPRPP